jgi:YggT family protein
MLSNIVLLVVETVGGFFTVLFLARLYMQWTRTSFRNEIGHFVVKLTDWAVLPLRRVVPGAFGIDLPSLIAACLVQSLLVLLAYWLHGANLGGEPLLATLLILATGFVETVRVFVYMVIGIVIVMAVLSWVNPHSPFAPVSSALARPFLRPFQRIVPTVANIDLSPLVLLLVLQVVLLVLASARAALVPLFAG